MRDQTRPGRCRVGQERKFGSVTYQDVGTDYFEKRRLRRHAGMWSLWGLGVGAVISGEYYGWNFGLGTGGFGGLAVAAVFMAIMYYCLVYSIAEMSPALPHTGGAYSFARSAMGPWGGFLTGLAENMEYVITPAVVVGAMGLLAQQIVVGLFSAGGHFNSAGSVVGAAWWNSLPFWCSSSSPRSSRGSSTSRCGRTSRAAGRRSRGVAARPSRSASPGSSSPYRSRSGSSWPSRRCRSRPRSRWIPAATSPGDRSSHSTPW